MFDNQGYFDGEWWKCKDRRSDGSGFANKLWVYFQQQNTEKYLSFALAMWGDWKSEANN